MDTRGGPAVTLGAPKGKYEWLDEGVYVGTIGVKPGGGAVIIRVFKVV